MISLLIDNKKRNLAEIMVSLIVFRRRVKKLDYTTIVWSHSDISGQRQNTLYGGSFPLPHIAELTIHHLESEGILQKRRNLHVRPRGGASSQSRPPLKSRYKYPPFTRSACVIYEPQTRLLHCDPSFLRDTQCGRVQAGDRGDKRIRGVRED